MRVMRHEAERWTRGYPEACPDDAPPLLDRENKNEGG